MRRIATVTISAPLASCAACMTAIDGYLPVPTIKPRVQSVRSDFQGVVAASLSSRDRDDDLDAVAVAQRADVVVGARTTRRSARPRCRRGANLRVPASAPTVSPSGRSAVRSVDRGYHASSRFGRCGRVFRAVASGSNAASHRARRSRSASGDQPRRHGREQNTVAIMTGRRRR